MTRTLTLASALAAALVFTSAAGAARAEAPSSAKQIASYVAAARAFPSRFERCGSGGGVSCALDRLNSMQAITQNILELFALKLSRNGSAACRASAHAETGRLAASETATYTLILDLSRMSLGGPAVAMPKYIAVGSTLGRSAAGALLYRRSCL